MSASCTPRQVQLRCGCNELRAFADEEEFEGMDEDDDDEQPISQVAAARLGAQDERTKGTSGGDLQLHTVQEDEEGMADEEEEQLPDMAQKRCAQHTDSVVAVAWSPQQPNLVASGGCDDHAYLWRSDKGGVAA